MLLEKTGFYQFVERCFCFVEKKDVCVPEGGVMMLCYPESREDIPQKQGDFLWKVVDFAQKAVGFCAE